MAKTKINFQYPLIVKEEQKPSNYQRVQTGWKSEARSLESCGIYDKETSTVFLSMLVRAKISALLNKYKNKEWLAYLIGQESKDNYIVDDLAIPKQEIAIAGVEVCPDDTVEAETTGIIGTIHSHNTMSAFFSGTDIDYVTANHPIAIVVSDSGWACKVRHLLPCSHFIITDANLSIIQTVSCDMEELNRITEERIKEKSYAVSSYRGAYYDHNYDPLRNRTCVICKQEKPWTELNWFLNITYCDTCKPKVAEMDFERKGEYLRKMEEELKKKTADKSTAKGYTKDCLICNTELVLKEVVWINNKPLCETCSAYVKELSSEDLKELLAYCTDDNRPHWKAKTEASEECEECPACKMFVPKKQIITYKTARMCVDCMQMAAAYEDTLPKASKQNAADVAMLMYPDEYGY